MESEARYAGMGMDEMWIIDKHGLDAGKERNHRGRYRFARLVRYLLSQERLWDMQQRMVNQRSHNLMLPG